MRADLCACLKRPLASWQQTVEVTGSAFDEPGQTDRLLARMRAQLRVYMHDIPDGLVSNLTRRMGGDHAYISLHDGACILLSPGRVRVGHSSA